MRNAQQHKTRTATVRLYQWASTRSQHGMPGGEDLERDGWVRTLEHPWYPGTWLYERQE